jgi:diguanylate cyclase (GGDEF)-like protein/PAS domain S-box-containing protein
MSRRNISNSIELVTAEGVLYTLMAIFVGTLFAWMMGTNLTKDIYKLIGATQKVQQGERDIALSLKRKDELKALSENFQAMLTTIQDNEQALFTEKERAEITLKSIGDGVITTDYQGRITYLNPVAEHLTGWSSQSAKGQPIEEIFAIYNEENLEPVENPALKSMQLQKIIALSNHTILINRAGEKISIEDSGAPIIDKSGQTIGSVLVFHDATDARELKRRLTWQALHDPLTGLKNRQAFENQLENLISDAQQDNSNEHSLIYIDLDQFKIVNDTVGHQAGDELLKQVAIVLKQQTRDSDLLARIGGDEFALLLENCSTEDAATIAEKLRSSLAGYQFIWENRGFDIGASIGITAIHAASNKAGIMSQADVACYLAKDQGRNRVHIYREDDQVLAQQFNQLNWVSHIKEAIKQERFVLFAQEIVPLQHASTQKRVEILTRLMNEEGRIITPDQFLPAAERFNLMAELDIYVTKQAIGWLQSHADAIELININISGQSLGNPQFNAMLLQVLENNQALNHKVCFEITETAAITHMSASISFLNSIKNFGCKLALDDFGSGFSSFGWLKSLPVDFVKIDGNFILDVLSDNIDAAMVKAIHQITVEMNIDSIAEFVENQEVSDWLKAVGIEYAQGYHFHKPSPIDTFF